MAQTDDKRGEVTKQKALMLEEFYSIIHTLPEEDIDKLLVVCKERSSNEGQNYI